MQEPAVIAGERLVGVAEGVAEIEQRPLAGELSLVGPDHRRLDLERPADGDGERARLARQHRWPLRLQPVEEVRILDEGVLHDLGVAGLELALGQAVQDVGVDQDSARLMEGAHQVLAMARVDSRLAADRAVDLAQQGRRDLDIVEAAQGDGGGEAGKVADHPAAECQHDRAPLDAVAEQIVDQPLAGAASSSTLARRQHDASCGDAGTGEAGLQPVRVAGAGEVLVGDDDRPRAAISGASRSPARSRTPRPMVIVVAALGQGRRGAGLDRASSLPAGARRRMIRSTTASCGSAAVSITWSASA